MIYNPRDPDFSFINCDKSITFIRIAYNIVTYNDLWEFLYEYNSEPTSENREKYDFLREKIRQSSEFHTEESINWTMEVILYIAKNGYFKYKQLYLIEYEKLTKKTLHQIIKERLENQLKQEIKEEIDNHIISKDYLDAQLAISLEKEKNYIPEVSVLDFSYKS